MLRRVAKDLDEAADAPSAPCRESLFQSEHGMTPSAWVQERVLRGLDLDRSQRLCRDLQKQAVSDLGR